MIEGALYLSRVQLTSSQSCRHRSSWAAHTRPRTDLSCGLSPPLAPRHSHAHQMHVRDGVGESSAAGSAPSQKQASKHAGDSRRSTRSVTSRRSRDVSCGSLLALVSPSCVPLLLLALEDDLIEALDLFGRADAQRRAVHGRARTVLSRRPSRKRPRLGSRC